MATPANHEPARVEIQVIADLLAYAEELEIENASTLRKQDMMFAILTVAENDIPIYGTGVWKLSPMDLVFCARRRRLPAGPR